MKTKIFFMALAAMLLLSCNRATQNKTMVQDEQLVQMNAPKSEDKNKMAADTATHSIRNAEEDIDHAASPTKTITDWDKKIIKTADIKLELKDYNNYNSNIHKNLKAFGAYISKEEQSQYDGMLQNNITIKVPVEKFDDLVNSFSGEGISVIEKKINTEDVTGELVDGKARMEAKKQIRRQYLALLKQAKNMKDILEVQKEINDIQEQIESVNGRIDYLSHQSAYSTINLNYYQFLNGTNPSNNHPSFITKIADAFTNGFSIIGNLSIFMVSIWPILVIIGLVIILYKRRKWQTQKTVQ